MDVGYIAAFLIFEARRDTQTQCLHISLFHWTVSSFEVEGIRIVVACLPRLGKTCMQPVCMLYLVQSRL
jgi:hypothetical protein